MILDQDVLNQIVADAKADIATIARQSVRTQIAECVAWNLRDAVSKATADFIKTDILPEVGKALLADKGAIIEAVQAASEAVQAASKTIGGQLAAAMVKQATENLSKSWDVQKVIDGLFK